MVAFTVRRLAILATVLATTAAPAGADEDPDYHEFPCRALALGIQGHGTRIGGQSESGVGATVEYALGRERWQYFVESSLATAGFTRWVPSGDAMFGSGGLAGDVVAHEVEHAGLLIRGGLGLRWLARQFTPNGYFGMELYLTSHVGVQRYQLADLQLTRPELALGLGVQFRGYRRPRGALGLDIRVLYTPSDPDSALVACSGDCMSGATSGTGFLLGSTLSW